MIKLIKYEDPLTADEVDVTDVSTAFYALKYTNDLSFAVKYMAQNTEKEYSRNVSEIFTLEHDLVAPYLETDTSVTSEGFEVTVRLTSIPKPLPDVVPEKIRKAVEYLDKQLALDKKRLDADLAADCAPLNESRKNLESKVKAWFKSEVESNADWLNGSRKVCLSGGTLEYSGGKVTFSYKEMNYD